MLAYKKTTITHKAAGKRKYIGYVHPNRKHSTYHKIEQQGHVYPTLMPQPPNESQYPGYRGAHLALWR